MLIKGLGKLEGILAERNDKKKKDVPAHGNFPTLKINKLIMPYPLYEL